MNIGIAVLITAALGAGIYWFGLRNRSSSGKPENTGSGIPEGKEDNYALGTHPGEDGIPIMYTLTTCRHCVHLKEFLDNNGISHNLVYVDDFQGQARFDMMGVLRSHNPRGSFPTLILPGGRTLVGFRENEMREAFNLPPKK